MSEDNFLLSDTIKSKKIILNEKDLSEDLSSLHVVASTNTGGGEASDEDISSLAAASFSISQDLNAEISSLHVVASTNTDSGAASDEAISSLVADNTSLAQDLDQNISSLSFSEAEINQQFGLDVSSLHADNTQTQEDINSISQDLLTSNQLINSNANSISDLEENISSLSLNQVGGNLDSINESISSLSVKDIGSIEQVSTDYSVNQDSDIFAEYRINESTAGLANISDSLSISSDATLNNDYFHYYNHTLNGIDISLSQNNIITIPSVFGESNSELFISYAFLVPQTSDPGSSSSSFFRSGGGFGLDYVKDTNFGMEMNVTAGATTLKVRAKHGSDPYMNTSGAFTLHIENYTSGSVYAYGEENMGAEMRTTLKIIPDVTTVGDFIQRMSEWGVEISIVTGSEDASIFDFIGTYSESYDGAFRDDFIIRKIEGAGGYGGQTVLKAELSFITIKQTGEILTLNNGNNHSFFIQGLDFSNTNELYYVGYELTGLPYIIMGRDYSLIDKVQWYLANQLNALDSLPSGHTYKNTAPEGSTQEYFISDDAFFYSFYQDYLQLKQTVSSLSAS